MAELTAAISTAIDKSTPPAVSKQAADNAAAKTVEAMRNDPVLANATGQERWWQSGVGLFGQGGVIWALGILFSDVAEHGADFASYDLKADVAALGALVLAIGVLYRRFVPGLKPLFWRWGS
jgi:hypothetical protein